jgi:hypothetical protein
MRYLRPALIGLLYIGSAIGASWAANQLFAPTQGEPSPSPGSEPFEIDLGELWESPARTVEIPFRNSEPSPLQIGDVRVSCHCTDLAPKAFLIPPRGETRATATIDLTHRSPREIGSASRPFQLTFEPITKDGPAVPPVHVRAVIRSCLTSDRLDLHFGENCIRGEPPVSRTVRVTAHVPVRRVLAKVEPAVAAVTVGRSADDPTRFDVRLTPDTSLAADSYTAKLLVTAVDETGVERFGASVPVTFTLLAARPLFPRQVYLPSGPVGVARDTWLEADPRTKRRLTVESVVSEAPEVTVRTDRATDGSLPKIQVTVTPSKSGAGVARIAVRVRDADTQATEIFPVDLHYTAE